MMNCDRCPDEDTNKCDECKDGGKKMNAVKSEVEALVSKELASANEKFGPFNSAHEGYAVIKEEVEEAQENFDNVKIALDELWKMVKGNVPIIQLIINYENDSFDRYHIEALKSEAINAAVELIQVAAMAQKFTDMGR
jgi:hypothetical protein